MKKLFNSAGIFRVITLSLILTLLFIFISPTTFDAVFILFLESIIVCVVVLVMSFFGKDFLDIFMQVLVSIFVIPIMLFFVACGFFLFLLIYTGGGPDMASAMNNELITASWLLMDEPGIATGFIIHYFGNDLYYYIGGIVLYHIVSLIAIKMNPKKSADLWFNLKKQFMLQCLALLMAALILSVPMSIAIASFESNPWLTFASVIGLRLLIEIWKLYMESDKKVDVKTTPSKNP